MSHNGSFHSHAFIIPSGWLRFILPHYSNKLCEHSYVRITLIKSTLRCHVHVTVYASSGCGWHVRGKSPEFPLGDRISVRRSIAVGVCFIWLNIEFRRVVFMSIANWCLDSFTRYWNVGIIFHMNGIWIRVCRFRFIWESSSHIIIVNQGTRTNTIWQFDLIYVFLSVAHPTHRTSTQCSSISRIVDLPTFDT